MKSKLLCSFIVLGSLLLAMVDPPTPFGAPKRRTGGQAGQPAKKKADPDKPFCKGEERDWIVRLHLTDLDEESARDFQGLLVKKFSGELDQGCAFVTVQKGDGDGST